MLAPRGQILLLALDHSSTTLTPAAVVQSSATIVGANAFVDELPEAIARLAADPAMYEPVVTDAVLLSEFAGVVRAQLERPGGGEGRPVSVVNFPDIARMRTTAFAAYRPGKPARTPAGKLSSNESALGPAPGVIEAVAVAMRDAHRYPDVRPLTRMVAAQEQMPKMPLSSPTAATSCVTCWRRSSSNRTRRWSLSDPCYQIDAVVTRLYRGRPEFVPLRADGGQDLDAMLPHAQDAKLVWLPTPHNPTGIAVEPDELHGFLEAVPSACLVVLDEAYRAYVDGDRRRPCRSCSSGIRT